jgi:hypothetical protein
MHGREIPKVSFDKGLEIGGEPLVPLPATGSAGRRLCRSNNIAL